MSENRPVYRNVPVLIACAAFSLVSVSEAQAGAFGIREQSAYSQGASFAGAATCGDSIQGAFWNPAAIGCADTITVEGSFSLIIPQSDVETRPGSTFLGFGDPGDIGKTALVPAAAVAVPITDAITFGVTANGPFGLATETNFNHAGQVYARTGKIFSLAITPTLAFELAPGLILGAGVSVQYFDLVEFSRGLGPLPGTPSGVLEGDDIGVGFTLGALFRPAPGTEIGIGYRSTISHTLEGNQSTPAISVPVTADLETPDLVTASVRQRITDQFTLLGTIEWANWSRLGTIPVLGPGGAVVSTLPLNYEDGWFFALGGEYMYDEDVTIRAGAAWEVSPISTDTRNISLPDDDRLWLSLGATIKASENMTLNAGYSFITTFDTQIDIVPGNPWFAGPSFVGEVDTNIHILAAGLKWQFSTGEQEPLFVKY